MKAIISVLAGMIALVLIAGMQLNMLMIIKMNSAKTDINPTSYSIGFEVKAIVLILGIVAILTSILYSRTNERKLKIISAIGFFFGLIGILLCFFPLYYFIKL